MKTIQILMLCVICFQTYGYDELIEVDPVLTDRCYVNGGPWECELMLEGSPWLLDDVKKVLFERLHTTSIVKRKYWKNECRSKKRSFGSSGFNCMMKVKARNKKDITKMRVKIWPKKGKSHFVYFDIDGQDIVQGSHRTKF